MANLSSDIPLIEVPLVDASGKITETWFLFFVQLFRRTGGSGGTNSLTVGDVLALEDTFSPVLAVNDEGVCADMIVAPTGSESRMAEMVLAYASSSVVDQTFSAETDFTPGTTSSLTLATSIANAAHLWVFFDGTYQGDDQYTLTGSTLSFADPIPVGVNKVYVKGLI